MTQERAYEILGLDSAASLDDAKKAYRELVKVYHPDKNLAPNASVMFRLIQDAWECIQNTTEYKSSGNYSKRNTEDTQQKHTKVYNHQEAEKEAQKFRMSSGPYWSDEQFERAYAEAECNKEQFWRKQAKDANLPYIVLRGASLPHVPEFRGCGDYDNSHYVSPSLRFLWSQREIKGFTYTVYTCTTDDTYELIHGMNCIIKNTRDFPTVTLFPSEEDGSIWINQDNFMPYIKTVRVINNTLRAVFMHQFQNARRIFPDLIDGKNCTILADEKRECVSDGLDDYRLYLVGKSWVQEGYTKQIPRVAFREPRSDDTSWDGHPRYHTHPQGKLYFISGCGHCYYKTHEEIQGKTYSVYWWEGHPRLWTGNSPEKEKALYPDLVHGLNCTIQIYRNEGLCSQEESERRERLKEVEDRRREDDQRAREKFCGKRTAEKSTSTN